MSFATTTDIASICQGLIGRGVLAATPIGEGRNSRVFHVYLAGTAPDEPASVVLKFYRRDPGDDRDRLRVAFNALRFLWQYGIHTVPQALVADRDHNCALYQYIPGEVVTASDVVAGDIDRAVEFLAALRRLSRSAGDAEASAASEACFTVTDVMSSVRSRLGRLQLAEAESLEGRALHAWIDRSFAPLYATVERWVSSASARWAVSLDGPLPQAARSLSPSDFGFHNAIRRPDGSLAFVDFEYFGWDDPAKTLVDYLLHPGMSLAEPLKQRFAAQFARAFDGVPRLVERSRIVYPLFGLKWCLIILNDFLPDRSAAATPQRRADQLAKAQALAERLAADFADNPYLAGPR